MRSIGKHLNNWLVEMLFFVAFVGTVAISPMVIQKGGNPFWAIFFWGAMLSALLLRHIVGPFRPWLIVFISLFGVANTIIGWKYGRVSLWLMAIVSFVIVSFGTYLFLCCRSSVKRPVQPCNRK